MKKIRFTYTLLCLLLVAGCTKDDADFRVPQFEIPQFTGYYASDEAGQYMGSYGIPNVKLGDQPTRNQSRYYITIFPNPAHHILSVYIKSPSQHEKKFWITQAIPALPFIPITVQTGQNNNFIAGGSPLIQGKFTEDIASLNLSELPDGYYRLYIEVDGIILYDNLLIDRSFNFNN